LPVEDVYPKQIPDLFSSKPIMIHGRLRDAADGAITLRGNTVAGPFERKIRISPANQEEHDALASLWARAKAQDLMLQSFAAPSEATKQQVTQLGLDYRLMTPFTSFVAVEEMTLTVGGQPTKIAVPVEMPEGVSYEGVFGSGRRGAVLSNIPMIGQFFRGGATTGIGGQLGGGGFAGAPATSRVEALEARDLSQPATPAAKLAEPLRDLAAKVEKEGKDGNLTVGKLRLIKYKVDVMIYLRDTSDKTLAALKQLGFAQTGESKAIRLLIGALDVRKLEELAKLEAVIRVTPVSQ
ncbi:MAG TPA: hypothetical protein VNA16_04420, partial [Abditibacteriaceae bacterium]|nr:hypothetical protein [Abditibacteriaceae bacterium]